VSLIRPLIVLSNVIVDHITAPDGSTYSALGGAATYAACGAACWWPAVTTVAGIGRDLDELMAQAPPLCWFDRAHLVQRDEHTIRSRIEYHADGERLESPVLGFEHFERMQTTAADIPDEVLPAAATYCFKDLSEPFWDSLWARRARLGVLLWELQGSVATAKHWPALRHVLPRFDIFSLNLTEAQGLLGPLEPDEILDALLGTGVPITLLRMGAQGAMIADRTRRLRLTPPPSRVIDVTGAGNSFCGGFLGGWCATHDLEEAARAAAAAAAYVINVRGAPATIVPAELAALAAATGIEPVGVLS